MVDKITFKKFAELVLEDVKKPLSPLEIWEKGKEIQLSERLKTTAKTPWLTIGAQIYVDIRDNPSSLFYQYNSRPANFYLSKFKEEFKPEEAPIEELSEKDTSKTKYHERDLHSLLVKFVDSSLDFNAHVKTVYHEIAKRDQKGLNEWIHPDLVGVYLPFKDFTTSTRVFQSKLYWTAVKFFSFELKRDITLGNCKQSFFQAVSNSSWGNEGYLVALLIDENNEDLMGELKRLSNSFGIGVIKLTPGEDEEGKILFPAKIKDELDWETLDNLMKNKDFEKFMKSVERDINEQEITNERNYDKILDDEEFEKYVKDKGILE